MRCHSSLNLFIGGYVAQISAIFESSTVYVKLLLIACLASRQWQKLRKKFGNELIDARALLKGLRKFESWFEPQPGPPLNQLVQYILELLKV